MGKSILTLCLLPQNTFSSCLLPRPQMHDSSERTFNGTTPHSLLRRSPQMKKNVNVGGGGPWVCKSGYTIYHRVSPLLPHAENNAKYAQLYFYDPKDALQIRLNRNEGRNRDTMDYLQNTLLQNNRYNALFYHSKEVLDCTPSRELHIRLLADPDMDLRRYNPPSENEIAVIVPGDETRAVDEDIQ
jgi:hypothetical protein